MSEALEKIWAVEGLCEILSFNTYDNGGTEYTLTNVAEQAERKAWNEALRLEIEALIKEDTDDG